MIIDTHVHYDDEQFDIDRDELFTGLRDNHIELVVNVGASIQTSKNTIELMKKYSFLYGAIGVHPTESMELNEGLIEWLRQQSSIDKVVAIGEIGLDYYWDKPERDIQKHWFERQMQLAKEVKLPIIVHSRDAANDTVELMKVQKAREIGGVIHCFSYGKEMAREFLNMDFYLGIGGVVTFHNAMKLKEVVAYMPMDRIVLETDCPYLSPVPNRGKRNSSLNLEYVINQIADLKKMTYAQVVEVTNENAKKLYNIKK